MARLACVAIVILGVSGAFGPQSTARADLPGPGDDAGPPGSAPGTPGTPPGATASTRQLRLVPSVPGEPLSEGEAIRVAVGSVVTVRFPGAVYSAEAATFTQTVTRPAPQLVSAAVAADTVAITTLPGVRSGTATTLDIRGEFAPFALPIHIIEDKAGVTTQWVAEPNGDLEAREREKARIEAEARAEHERETRRREDAAREDSALEMSVQMSTELFYPHSVRQLVPDSPLEILTAAGTWLNGRFHLPLRIANSGDRPIPTEGFRLRGSDGTTYRPNYWLESSHGSPSVTIDPDSFIDGAVAIPAPKDGKRPLAPFTLERLGPDGKPTQGIEIDDIDPEKGVDDRTFLLITKQDVRDRMEREAARKRLREARRVSLHVVASYGAIWLPAGVIGADGTEALEPASLKGLGMRVTKGLLPLLALEAEIGGATSGTAEYGTVIVDGTEGELTRSAMLGRVQFGGVLRLGDKIVPTLRLGVALQVVSQDASVVTAGGEMSGPESGVEVAGGVYGGAGVDFKLGSNLVAGLGFSFTAAQHNQQILDVGLSLAYRWDPPKNTGGDF